jgi:hypothetical protein
MLLVTLLFVLTTRGFALDIHSAGRIGTQADLATPATLPIMNRTGSGFQFQRERLQMERPMMSSPEYRKLSRSWRAVNASAESVQSAPTSPEAISRPWHSSRTATLNHYHMISDNEHSENDDSDVSNGFSGASSLELRGATNNGVDENMDYPTPASTGEIFE